MAPRTRKQLRRFLRPNAVATLLALFAVLFASVGAQGSVLCLGFDGHISIESAIVGLCSFEELAARAGEKTERAWSASTASGNPGGERCCGTCTDTLLIAGEPALKASSVPSTCHLACCLPQTGSAPVLGGWQRVIAPTPLPFSQIRDALRTTVIRC